jgi:molybdopterin-guanine dinucleotide biosynthesis protein B
MPAIISIVGHSNSGKTTLLEKVVRELKSRGYKIATAKHTPQEVSLDEPGKDSWRHLEAGSSATAVGSRDRIMLMKPITPDDDPVSQIIGMMGEDYDILIIEGFKQSEFPKIEVHRRETGPLLKDIGNIVAVAAKEPVETDVRQFLLDDPLPLADFIEAEFIKKDTDRLSIYVNDKYVPLIEFPNLIITNIVQAIIASLKRIEKPSSIKIFFKKKSDK